jgi:hypothetical protein
MKLLIITNLGTRVPVDWKMLKNQVRRLQSYSSLLLFTAMVIGSLIWSLCVLPSSGGTGLATGSTLGQEVSVSGTLC